MTAEIVSTIGLPKTNLVASPIRPSWVLDGNPIARNRVLSSSADGMSSTLVWDCTAGRFNWFYDVDETVYVIDGDAVIKDSSGTHRRLNVGDYIFFPAGSRAEWHVEHYIRKIAFCRSPLPWPFAIARRGYRFLRRLTGNGGIANAASAMIQNNREFS